MTHHHNHARKHARLNADTRRKLATENSGNDIQPAHDHHHRDVHSQPETHAADEPAPIAHHDIDRRNGGEVVQTVTTYVATEFDLLIESGTKTIADFTVSTLPAVVTVSDFGVITVPANAAGSPVTGGLPSPVETDAAPATAVPSIAVPSTGATAMMATANHQVPLVSSATSSSISETTQSSATQSIASDTSSVSSDVESATTTAAAETTVAAAPMAAATTSGASTTSISTSIPSSTSDPTSISTSILDSTTASAITSASGSSVTSSGDASASTLLSTTDPASSASTSSASSTLSAGSTASSGDGGTLVSATSSSSSSTAGAESSGSSGGVNETPKIVGGVVGGVLGLLLLLVFAFLLLRWKRRRATAAGVERTFGRGGVLGGDTESSKPRAPEMSSWRRPSNTAVAAGAFLGRRQPSSPGYADENPTGERGFQKISGRKIQSVLRTGGDGYGDEIEEEPIPDRPFGPSSPVSPMSAFHGDYHQSPLVRLDSGDGAMMRPSPARTATTGSSVDLMGSSPPWQLGTPVLRPDSLGRSLSRQDGSRNSRFTEGI
ncbi:uncharacterized protein TRUGW13939_03815 [Talaromyces rugulosus]|uniref:Mid2 domain-containing protein n=1 Tax=Talaromyces rugulosus TaxID=121627 RepID=A0A7H8QS34_TALRU|nr:uncharacterized protein TRUGW13939_03815 [Talaromyces rugulosus]QKX56709.1 hypothetical protein TRUGW13939_03815 [Talaromyces rugulosus]